MACLTLTLCERCPEGVTPGSDSTVKPVLSVGAAGWPLSDHRGAGTNLSNWPAVASRSASVGRYMGTAHPSRCCDAGYTATFLFLSLVLYRPSLSLNQVPV